MPGSTRGNGELEVSRGVNPKNHATADMDTFEIQTVEEGGILRFTLKGPSSYKNLLQAAATIIAETKRRAIWHVLCDATAMPAPMGAVEKWDSGDSRRESNEKTKRDARGEKSPLRHSWCSSLNDHVRCVVCTLH